MTKKHPIVPGRRGHSIHRVGDRLPAVLILSDLAPIFGLSVHRLWRLEKCGDLKRFETRARVGNRARYSGKKVQAWLDGSDDDVSTVASAVLQPFFFKRS